MIDNTPDSSQTNATQSAAQPQPVQPAQPQPQPIQPQSVPSTQPQPQSVQSQPTQPTPQPQMVSNASATTAPTQDPNANHPAVKHASVIRTIAETLAGGPRFKPVIDPATGKTSYQRVPLDKKDIGMAIALSAIQGSLAGLQAKGPNATAQAAGLGFNATASAREKQDQEANEQANRDYARQLQTTEANLRMHANAVQAGTMDYESNQKYVDHFADLYKTLQNSSPDAIRGIVNESDLKKYHVTKDSAIPVAVVKRIDPTTGDQAVDRNGVPQWDLQYAVIDPLKVTEVTDADKADNAKWGRKGYINGAGNPTSLPNLELRLNTQIADRAAVGAGKLTQMQLDKYAEETGGKPIDISVIAKKDPTFLNRLVPWTGSGPESLTPELLAQKPQLYGQVKDLFNQIYPVDQYLKDHAPLPDAKDSKQAAILRDSYPKGSKQWSYYEQQRKTFMSQEEADSRAKTAGEAAKQDMKDTRTSVYALDPQTHELVFTNRADAEAKGMQGIEEVKAGDIQKDRAALRQLNDVQMNLSRYTAAANTSLRARPTKSDYINLHSILNKAGIADLNVAISEGGHVSIPLVSSVLEGMSRQEKSDAYRLLSPQAKALLDGYIRSLSAVPAYQKALTGIGRSNKEMLDLELANIPNPTMEPEDIQRKLSQFQENVDRASEGFPKLPGLQHPREVKDQYERQFQQYPSLDFPLPKLIQRQ